MSKFKIVNLIDKIFISTAVFLIIYGWINFYLKNLWITFILSLIFSFACIHVLNYFIQKKQNRITLSKKNVEEISKNFLAFQLYNTKKKLELLNKILSLKFNTTLFENTIIAKEENKKTLFVLATEFEIITSSIFINIISEYSDIKVNEIKIICNEVSNNINTTIFKDKSVSFINKNCLYYDYFLKSNLFPDISNINLSCYKLKFSDVLKNFFTPNKAKGYFTCGLILIFSSIILPYHFYYIIVGSTLLLFSIICKILPLIKHH